MRYALLAEQGAASAELNLAWLMHRGLAYHGADRHRLALGLWERAAFRGQTEGRLMAAHVLLDGHKYGLEGGERVLSAHWTHWMWDLVERCLAGSSASCPPPHNMRWLLPAAAQ